AYASFTYRSTLHRFFLHNEDGADKKTSLLARVLKLDERIVHYITNPALTYDELDSVCQIIKPNETKDRLIIGVELHHRLLKFSEPQRNAIYYLWGSEG